MKTAKILAPLICLAVFALAAKATTASSIGLRVTMLEFYIDGQKTTTYTNSPQSVSLALPESGVAQVRICAILERDDATEIPVEASTAVENPLYTGYSEAGNLGQQDYSEWSAITALEKNNARPLRQDHL